MKVSIIAYKHDNFISLVLCTDLQIGFRLPQYNYSEPDPENTTITNVTLIKVNNIITEQTFGVSVSFGDPGEGLVPATLHEIEEIGDFVVNMTAGQRTIILPFRPNETEVIIPIPR